ncbi:hypothetical protein JCM15519_17810 [Fundidesulfovibrio butyratiphilus]
MNIYLADLVHDYLGGGSYMMPLNIGFISAYTKHRLNDVHTELFKYPNALLARIKASSPDILGLSNYTWNANLNLQVAKFMKRLRPETVVVMGGPDIDVIPEMKHHVLCKDPEVDFYVLQEGEIGFMNLLQRLQEVDFDIPRAKLAPIDGVAFVRDGDMVWGELLPRIQDVNTIPSPYLTGELDQFFDTNLVPIVETNRGCPFTCTYCAQGLASKHIVKKFDIDRVKNELTYIAEHVKNTNLLTFADANFGIFDRDIEIAEHIHTLQEKYNYPRRTTMNWIKTDKCVPLAKTIGEAACLCSSLQSMDPVVLKEIKRHNIPAEQFKNIIKQVNEFGGLSATEIILALPSETKESHLNSLRTLFDWNVSYIICYNCLLLNGTELTLPEQRQRYALTSKFRLLDSGFGQYGDNDILSFEYEEGVRSTSTMTEEEILSFRPVHWLIQFMWNYRFYYPMLKFLQQNSISPLDFIVELIRVSDTHSPVVAQLFQEFKQESIDEWFDTPEDLIKHFSEPKNFEDLRAGAHGKLNGKYIWKVILECYEQFSDHVCQTAKTFLPEQAPAIDAISQYCLMRSIDLPQIDTLEQPFTHTFPYDVFKWENSQYTTPLEARPSSYTFSLSGPQEHALRVLLKQYSHPNPNVMLRKLSEHMRITDLFLSVEYATSGAQ